MTDSVVERKKEEAAKTHFFLTGFTQDAGIRIYAFEGRLEARRIAYTVEVNLALIPGYGIRIQDLPLLCRELLQQGEEPDQVSAIVFTEQRMRCHAEKKLATAREEAEHKKKPPKPPPSADAEMAWRPPIR